MRIKRKTLLSYLFLQESFLCVLAAGGAQVVTDSQRVWLLTFFPFSFLNLLKNHHSYSRKLNGEGLNGLSYSELFSIENMLNQGLVVVEEQTDKVVFVIIIFSQSYRFDF